MLSGIGRLARCIRSHRRCRLKMNSGPDSLRQPVEDVRTECRRALKEIAQQEDVKSHLGGDFFQGPSTLMNGPAQMTAKGVLSGGLVEPLTAILQFRQLSGDLFSISTQLLQ